MQSYCGKITKYELAFGNAIKTLFSKNEIRHNLYLIFFFGYKLVEIVKTRLWLVILYKLGLGSFYEGLEQNK